MLKIGLKRRSCMDTSREFYMFVSPWIIGFLLFTLIPMLYSVYASFSDWNGMSSPVLIGIEEIINIFDELEKQQSKVKFLGIGGEANGD